MSCLSFQSRRGPRCGRTGIMRMPSVPTSVLIISRYHRHPNRSARVGAHTEVGEPARHGRRGARGGASAEAGRIVRVYRRLPLTHVADDGVGQLVHLGQAHDRCAAPAQPGHRGRITGGLAVGLTPPGMPERAPVTSDGKASFTAMRTPDSPPAPVASNWRLSGTRQCSISRIHLGAAGARLRLRAPSANG